MGDPRMKLRHRLGSWLTRDLQSGFYDNGGSSTSPAAWLINQLTYGVTADGQVDEWIAEGMPAVYACTHAISETVGQLPLKLFRRTSTGREVAEDHPLYVVLHDMFNPELTAYQGKEILTRHLSMWGRAYAYIQRNARGEVESLWPIHPMRVRVDRDGMNRKRWHVRMDYGETVVYPFNPDRPPILHLHLNSNEGLDGRSPIWINRQSLGLTKAAEDFVTSYFGNGAVPGVIISHPGVLSDKAIENFKRQWDAKFAGPKNKNKTALLPEDWKLTVLGVDPQKSQLKELRDDQVSAAARIWRVPSILIQNYTKDTSWGSGVAQLMIGWINTGLMPYFEQWQQAITRDLLSRQTYRSHYAKFITAALERGDLKSQMEAFAVARQNSILNANEIRAKMEENRIPGEAGEWYLIPSGTQVLADRIVTGETSPLETEPDPAAVSDEPEGVM